MKHLKKFNTNSAFESYKTNEDYTIPHVNYILENRSFDYKKLINYNFVDLGLPSGTLWCDRNIGAETIYDHGLYFAWGETEGYYTWTNDKKFTWDDYKYSPDGTGSNLTKYKNNIDNKKFLDIQDNPVKMYMGLEYDMMSNDNSTELIQSAYTEFTYESNYNNSGVNGFLCTSKFNGNSIFFPMTYQIDNGIYVNKTTNPCSRIWASNRDDSSTTTANSLYIDNYSGVRKFSGNDINRCIGTCCRAVYKPQS